ncbi:MAG: PhoH family protein [Minisyncoccia bacterium]
MNGSRKDSLVTAVPFDRQNGGGNLDHARLNGCNGTQSNDNDRLPSGILHLPDNFWETHRILESSDTDAHSRASYTMSGPALKGVVPNQALVLPQQNGDSIVATVRAINGDAVTFESIRDYRKKANKICGDFKARNLEQSIALNLLLDPEVHLVSLAGVAGTGKTLLTLAAAMHQIKTIGCYSQIIVTRSLQAMDTDPGSLPGTEAEKLHAWLRCIWDNLKELSKYCGQGDLEEIIEPRALAFARGSSPSGYFFIVDEAQNLSPKLMKSVVTRAGFNTKMIFLGNLDQIDNKDLDATTSGLTHLGNTIKHFPRGAALTLKHCERSEVADFGNKYL